MGRRINQSGLKLIEEFEGLRLKAYVDSVGVLTIGYGSTRNVKRGMVITRAEAEERLRDDLSVAEKGVETALTEDVTDNQFAACVSLAFNIGVSAFKKSSIVKFINSGDILLAADRFLLYNKGGGKVIAGLTRRRKAERALFLTDDEEPRTAPIKNGTVEPAPKATTTETIKTTTVEETPAGTKTEETSLVSKIANSESVKTIASEGVTKLATRATTALTTGSTASATGGAATGKMWLIVLSIVLAVGAIAVVLFLLWHKSSKEKEAARINSDKDRTDVRFAKP